MDNRARYDGDTYFVEDALPPPGPLTEEERDRILDNYRWFSKFSPVKKLLIAWRHRQVALYFQELARRSHGRLGIALLSLAVATTVACRRQEESPPPTTSPQAEQTVPDMAATMADSPPPSVQAGAPSTQRGEPAVESSKSIVARLGDASLSVQDRYQLLDVLRSRCDHETIDAVIDAYEDRRVFDPCYDGWQIPPEDGRLAVTVGQMCKSLARELIFGSSTSALSIVDTASWWSLRRCLPMDEIKRMAREAARTSR